jgi:hypothetical protein
MNVANDLVISVAKDAPLQTRQVVDLGCGMGASLQDLSEQMPTSGPGIGGDDHIAARSASGWVPADNWVSSMIFVPVMTRHLMRLRPRVWTARFCHYAQAPEGRRCPAAVSGAGGDHVQHGGL